MSHVATIDIEIKSLDDLEAAAKRIGLEFVRGQQTYRWWGESVGDYPLPDGFKEEDLGKCAHALRLPGTENLKRHEDDKPYEIGVVPRRDGRSGYTLLWDFFAGGNGLEAVVGKDCGRLKQAYATIVAKKQAQSMGFRVSEKLRSNGTVELVLTK